ncbi:MAG: hypothetical protein Q7J36_02050 [Thiobacillus sp.]|nr:hypothetical protein [Thiobacillus sp.]
MKTFDYKGRRVDFRAVTGEVTGSHKHAETYVSGSGGGGSTYNGHGRTAPVQISSTVVVKQEFFLKPTSGNEIPVKLRNEDIPLKDGQNVTMVSGHVGDKGEWTHLVNHNAALYWKLGNTGAHATVWGLVRNPAWVLLIGIAIWIAIAYLVNGAIGFLLAVAYWVFEWLNKRKATKELETHLDEIGRETLTSGATIS